MYENYIFDLYGTLVDIHTDESKPSLWKNMAQYITLQGAPYQPVELRKAYGKYIDELRVTPETEVNLALSLRKLYTEKGIIPTSEMIAHWALMFRTLSLKYVRLFDGAKEVLQELHRRKKKFICSPMPSVCSRNRRCVLWASTSCSTIFSSPRISAL